MRCHNGAILPESSHSAKSNVTIVEWEWFASFALAIFFSFLVTSSKEDHNTPMLFGVSMYDPFSCPGIFFLVRLLSALRDRIFLLQLLWVMATEKKEKNQLTQVRRSQGLWAFRCTLWESVFFIPSDKCVDCFHRKSLTPPRVGSEWMWKICLIYWQGHATPELHRIRSSLTLEKQNKSSSNPLIFFIIKRHHYVGMLRIRFVFRATRRHRLVANALVPKYGLLYFICIMWMGHMAT